MAKGEEECPVCLCEMTEPVLIPCGHSFCKICAIKTSSSENYYGGGFCPVCRVPFDKASFVHINLPSKINKVSFADGTYLEDFRELLGKRFRSSTKLDRLILEIKAKRDAHSTDKLLVFSQFTHMLDFCEVSLKSMNPPVKFQRLDGSMSTVKREQALKIFREDSEQEVLLMSLKAGCLGLNITCANIVILLDPWWNAAVEQQAIGRSYRIGQTKNVRVIRFIANETVEVKMLGIQERKKTLASDALGFEQFAGDFSENKSGSKLTLEELKEFFI